MRNEAYFYKLTPMIAEVGKKTTVTVSPLQPRYEFNENLRYSVKIYPMTRNVRNMVSLPEYRHDARAVGKSLVFTYTFDKEEEYVIKIYREEPHEKIVQLAMYALESDWYALRPLKGEFHCHSCRLIGKHTGSTETPGYTAADYRKAGYDFMALTDHECYAGSVEMQQEYKDVKLGMALLNGEEVHAPENFLHFIHIGGKESVNSMFHRDEKKYYDEVQHIIDTEDIKYHDKFLYASVLWVARKIKKVGGMAVLAHPHWNSNVYSMPDEMTEMLLRDNVFDAYEIVGAADRHANNMKAAFYYQMMSEGVKVPPVVGVSDSHGTTNGNFTRKYTVVFAKDNKSKDIVDAVKDYRTVAVETSASGEYEVYGTYRAVSFARFLIEWYFPYFPVVTAEEGRLMHAYILGDKAAGEKLSALAGQTTKLYKTLYGKK